MKKQLKRWAEATRANVMLKDDSGAALVEYGLLVGLIAVVCVAAIATVGTDIKNLFNGIGTCLTNVAGTPPSTAGCG